MRIYQNMANIKLESQVAAGKYTKDQGYRISRKVYHNRKTEDDRGGREEIMRKWSQILYQEIMTQDMRYTQLKNVKQSVQQREDYLKQEYDLQKG